MRFIMKGTQNIQQKGKQDVIIYVKAVAPHDIPISGAVTILPIKQFVAAFPGFTLVHVNGPSFPPQLCFSHDTFARGTSQSLQEFHGHF